MTKSRMPSLFLSLVQRTSMGMLYLLRSIGKQRLQWPLGDLMMIFKI